MEIKLTIWKKNKEVDILEASRMLKTSSTSSGETKQDDTQLHYLGIKLIYPATTKEELTSTDLGRWTAIFSY